MKFSPNTPPRSTSRRLPSTLTWLAVAAASFAALTPAVCAAAGNNLAEFAPGRILVEPRAGLSNDAFDKILKVHGGKRRKVGQSNLHIVDLPANASPVAVIQQLARNPNLKFAELDRRVSSSVAVNDPYIGSAWHLAKVGAAMAWDTSMGAGVTVAILDSGVDGSHPDLVASLVPGYNFYDNNTNTADVCGHGTAVAGTAAAATNNGLGVAGVAGQARIMPVRIAYLNPSTGSCYAYYSTVASGLTYAADHGARVANVSYGGVAGSSAVLSAAQYMKNKGGLVFVSAGNSNIDENIAPTTSMIPVSATDSADAKASWSSFGSFVALAAPGTGIWTTSNGGSYSAMSGTSFSSPLTAGVAALLMAARPALGSAQIEQLMFASAVDLGAAGRDPVFGYGRVDAGAAMAAAIASVPLADSEAPSAAIAAPLANSSVSDLVAVNVNATDNVGVSRVELQVNGSIVAADSIAPYGFSWNSAGVANGMTTLVAIAYDAAGNSKASAPVTVNVANSIPGIVKDTTPPTVVIANPVSGMVSGNVTVTTNASDDAGAAGISQTVSIDGVVKATGTGASLAFNWNTRKIAPGVHTIQATARDAAGNTTTSSVQVSR